MIEVWNKIPVLESNIVKQFQTITDRNPELVITIGGDGSLLKTLQKYNFNSKYTYILISYNSFGFFSFGNLSNLTEIIENINNKNYSMNEIAITKVCFDKNEYYFLNDIRISENNNVISTNVKIENETFQIHNSGIIISSAAGSTGINKSFNGPILSINSKNLIITPIGTIVSSKFPITLTNPLVIDSRIELLVSANPKKFISLVIDNQEINYPNNKLNLSIEFSHWIKLICPLNKHNLFFNKYLNKL